MSNQPSLKKYPRHLLLGLSWTFRGEQFADITNFNAAVAAYQSDEKGVFWYPDEVILHSPCVHISPDIHWYLTDEHPTVEFLAYNGTSFTAGELLFKVHNRFVLELRQMDHKYFEGFSLSEPLELGKPPLYDLDLGS